jgi:hypothetical protein
MRPRRLHQWMVMTVVCALLSAAVKPSISFVQYPFYGVWIQVGQVEIAVWDNRGAQQWQRWTGR